MFEFVQDIVVLSRFAYLKAITQIWDFSLSVDCVSLLPRPPKKENQNEESNKDFASFSCAWVLLMVDLW